MHNYWFNNKVIEATAIDQELVELNKVLFAESNPCPIKFAAYKLGICNYELRLPLTKVSKKNEILISKALEKLNISFE